MRLFSYIILVIIVATGGMLYASDAGWSSYLSTLVQTTQSLPLRLILVMVLGMVLSLTPCIYPMIPITVGILQAQASKSMSHNFLLSLSYTVGIATTFAFLGLTAAYTGHLFGSIMTKPIVILPMVGMLVYLAGAMMGFYEMYTPRMLGGTSMSRGGSLANAFLFGAASGTMASPCLSPGLLLLLSIVTTLGSPVQGFMLLFAFGIGLSIPLLIIGTFSSSLNVLPRAGMWMVEVKKLFGLVIIGMCFYFLRPIMPHDYWLILARMTMLALGVYYIMTARSSNNSSWRMQKYVLAGILFSTSMNMPSLYNNILADKKNQVSMSWQTDYTATLAYARQEHKNILVDVTADYCSICKAIEKKFFFDESVIHETGSLVAVKIDAADSSHTVHMQLLQQYGVKGTPTFLVIEPHEQQLLAQFGSEVYSLSVQEFIALLKPYTK
jgi:thioredoxin:protein disulfide reductase